jgi:hypothetical protein
MDEDFELRSINHHLYRLYYVWVADQGLDEDIHVEDLINLPTLTSAQKAWLVSWLKADEAITRLGCV